MEKGPLHSTHMFWAELAWYVVTGCSKLTEECNICMAQQAVWNQEKRYGFEPKFWPDRLNQPLQHKTPSLVLVAPLGDLFHADISTADIHQTLHVMGQAKWHKFLLLTRRTERMLSVLSDYSGWPLPNVCPGVSVGNQRWADTRLPILAQIPVHAEAFRFAVCEPLIGPITLSKHLGTLGWVIAGAERGTIRPSRKARSCDPAWVIRLLLECRSANVPFFHHRSEDGHDQRKPGSTKKENSTMKIVEDVRVTTEVLSMLIKHQSILGVNAGGRLVFGTLEEMTAPSEPTEPPPAPPKLKAKPKKPGGKAAPVYVEGAEVNFGLTLAGARLKLGLSQSALGDLLGRSGTQVGRMEKGTAWPTAEDLQRINSALDTHFSLPVTAGSNGENRATQEGCHDRR